MKAHQFTLSSSAVKRAMLRHPSWASTYAVWALLEEGCDRASQDFSNGHLAGALGLDARTVRRHLAVLRALGLVLPIRPRADAGYEAIFVRRALPDDVRGMLKALYEGEVVVGDSSGSPKVLRKGDVVDLSAQLEIDAAIRIDSLVTRAAEGVESGSKSENLVGSPGLPTKRLVGSSGLPTSAVVPGLPRGVFSVDDPATTPAVAKLYGLQTHAGRVWHGSCLITYTTVVTTQVTDNSCEVDNNYSHVTTTFGSFDEPKEGLDLTFAARVIQLERELAAAKRTIARQTREKKTVTLDDRLADAVDRVAKDWQAKTGAKRISKRMRKHIETRMDEGHTETEFYAILAWVVTSEFHMGKNDRNTPYNTIPVLFGSEDRFLKYLNKATTAQIAGTGNGMYRAADDTARTVIVL